MVSLVLRREECGVNTDREGTGPLAPGLSSPEMTTTTAPWDRKLHLLREIEL